MRSNFTQLLAIVAMVALSFSVSAQTRYVDEVFTDVTVTSDVTYGQNYEVLTGAPVLKDLMMDVYEPTGDTETARPLVILAHAGSFLPQGVNTLPFGTRKDSAQVEMCMEFAKRGYVAVSMSYRLGWNPLGASQEERANTIINAVYRSMLDMKTCIRFFKDNEANGGNTYGIDPTRITVGGNNSGGYAALAAAYVNRPAEIGLFKFLDGMGNSFIDTNVVGKFDGSGGAIGIANNYDYPNETATIDLVLNLGGAIGDVSWMDPTDSAPVISMHESNNPLTPYGTAVVIVASTGDPIVEVSGGGDIHDYIADNNLPFNDIWTDASVDLSSPYTTGASNAAIRLGDTYRDGLYPVTSQLYFFEPWAWYNPNDPFIDTATAGASGYGSAANPFANPTTARSYIDTIMGYVTPRACIALDLPCAADYVGVKEITAPESRVVLYPQPASEQVTIANIDGDMIRSLFVYDISGRVVVAKSGVNQPQFILDRNGMKPGVYQVAIQTDKGTVFESMVLK